MRETDIKAWLKAIPAIDSVSPWGIWIRCKEQPNQNYIIIRRLSERRDNTFMNWWWGKTDLIEVSLVWWNSNTLNTDLEIMLETLDGSLLTNPCTPVFDFNWSKVQYITQGSTTGIGIELKTGRPILKKTYLFTYFQ